MGGTGPAYTVRALRRGRIAIDRFIGHSLGKVIVRNEFREGFRPGTRPDRDALPHARLAQLASALRQNRLFQLWTGDSGQKLADPEFFRTLPVPPVEFGVIVGDRGHRIGVDEPNDGAVSVEGAKLEGMSDFVVLHHTHTLIMMRRTPRSYVRSSWIPARSLEPSERSPDPG